MTESELVLTEQKVNDYIGVINRLKQDFTEVVVSHQDVIKKEQEVGRFSPSLPFLLSCIWFIHKLHILFFMLKKSNDGCFRFQ